MTLCTEVLGQIRKVGRGAGEGWMLCEIGGADNVTRVWMGSLSVANLATDEEMAKISRGLGVSLSPVDQLSSGRRGRELTRSLLCFSQFK